VTARWAAMALLFGRVGLAVTLRRPGNAMAFAGDLRSTVGGSLNPSAPSLWLRGPRS
jgi:hypothetical protein